MAKTTRSTTKDTGSQLRIFIPKTKQLEKGGYFTISRRDFNYARSKLKTYGALLLWMYMISLQPEKTFTISITYLADHLETSRNTIRESRDILINNGFLVKPQTHQGKQPEYDYMFVVGPSDNTIDAQIISRATSASAPIITMSTTQQQYAPVPLIPQTKPKTARSSRPKLDTQVDAVDTQIQVTRSAPQDPISPVGPKKTKTIKTDDILDDILNVNTEIIDDDIDSIIDYGDNTNNDNDDEDFDSILGEDPDDTNIAGLDISDVSSGLDAPIRSGSGKPHANSARSAPDSASDPFYNPELDAIMDKIGW